MADIVQLKENGQLKYMKTHVKAIDGVKDTFVSKTENEVVNGMKEFADGISVKGINIDTVVHNTISTGFGTSGILTRYGKLVTLTIDSNQTNGRSDGESRLTELIPLGFRPKERKSFVGIMSIGSAIQNNSYLLQFIDVDGSMMTLNKGMSAKPMHINLEGSWITEDPFPN